jgi:hypothetical protein
MRFRPLERRRFKTFLPPAEAILFLNPWRFRCFLLLPFVSIGLTLKNLV